MKIFIKSTTTSSYSLDVRATDTIEAVKKLIVTSLKDISIDDKQHLIFSGKQLDNSLTLSDYNIQNDATLHVENLQVTSTTFKLTGPVPSNTTSSGPTSGPSTAPVLLPSFRPSFGPTLSPANVNGTVTSSPNMTNKFNQPLAIALPLAFGFLFILALAVFVRYFRNKNEEKNDYNPLTTTSTTTPSGVTAAATSSSPNPTPTTAAAAPAAETVNMGDIYADNNATTSPTTSNAMVSSCRVCKEVIKPTQAHIMVSGDKVHTTCACCNVCKTAMSETNFRTFIKTNRGDTVVLTCKNCDSSAAVESM